MKELCDHALNSAVAAGADYADVRIIERRRQSIETRNGTVSTLDQIHSFGFGVRVLTQGAWGFASSPGIGKADLARVAREAAAVARASARVSAGCWLAPLLLPFILFIPEFMFGRLIQLH